MSSLRRGRKGSRKANRRRRRSRRRSNRRRYRRNAGFFKSLFRRNPTGLFALALVGLGGYVGHRIAANVISRAMARLGAEAAPVAPTEPPTVTSGLGQLATGYSGAIGGVAAAAIGLPLVMKFVEDPNTKQALVAGIVISAAQMIAVSVLKGVAPGLTEFLSGDDTAAKLSAMYGLRGTSIMPRYAPINGMGEYFAPSSMVNPMGEYFATPMAGGQLGEYFESGVMGLGNYTPNQEAYQAAAGYGEVQTMNTNHIDPGSNLDHELNIAEAAAGMGQPYQAAAGLPWYEAQAGMRGLGDGISTVPTSSTWIPGSSYPQLWAGVRPVSEPQSATMETPAGILSTPGGSGILG